MRIILLSGGSGKRLWPLSNEARSKQFLKLLPSPNGGKESMVQRVVRQIHEAGLSCSVTIATSALQKDSIINQLGEKVTVVTEPCRRDTFPAICLATAYLDKKEKCSKDEIVIVMPCDPYTEEGYFHTVSEMADAIKQNEADLVLMGITPTYPSAKYGYVIPSRQLPGKVQVVDRFTEKPNVETAEKFIKMGAYWNGGVFAFRLGYMTEILSRYIAYSSFDEVYSRYGELPKLSFDYEVAEKAKSVAVVPFKGKWKDLGTWNTLTDELKEPSIGNVISDSCDNTYIINELELPVVCIGAKDMVVAASPDGILVSERKRSENLKNLVDGIGNRPMYEERRWGEYKVIDYIEFSDGFCALTKLLTLRPDCSISYQRHHCREEIWTFINGEGEVVLDGERMLVKRGDVISIPKQKLHALRAITPLTFIEVQQGSNLVEEDIERFDWIW